MGRGGNPTSARWIPPRYAPRHVRLKVVIICAHRPAKALRRKPCFQDRFQRKTRKNTTKRVRNWRGTKPAQKQLASVLDGVSATTWLINSSHIQAGWWVEGGRYGVHSKHVVGWFQISQKNLHLLMRRYCSNYGITWLVRRSSTPAIKSDVVMPTHDTHSKSCSVLIG